MRASDSYQKKGDTVYHPASKSDSVDDVIQPASPDLSEEQLLEDTEVNLKAVRSRWKAVQSGWFDAEAEQALCRDDLDFAQDMYAWSDAATWILPVIPPQQGKPMTRMLWPGIVGGKGDHASDLRKL